MHLGQAVAGETAGTSPILQRLRIDIASPGNLESVRIIVDWEIHEEFPVGSRQSVLERAIDTTAGSWLAVECTGPADWHYPMGLWAHSNPIYLRGSVEEHTLKRSRDFWEEFRNNLDRYIETRAQEAGADGSAE